MSAVVNVPDPRDTRSDVELRVPADGAFVSVLRTTTAGLAARLDFSIDDIEDLRIAVGEACSLVLAEAAPISDLVGRFYLGARQLTVSVSVAAGAGASVDRDSFAWQVLSTLATAVSAEHEDGEFVVTLVMRPLLDDTDLDADLDADPTQDTD